MTDRRQAAQQALEAYEQHEPLAVVMHALRTALKQQAEPICYASINKQGDVCSTLKQRDSWRTVPLYTTPPQRKPLSDEQLDDISVVARKGNLHDLRIAIETAHNIKEGT